MGRATHPPPRRRPTPGGQTRTHTRTGSRRGGQALREVESGKNGADLLTAGPYGEIYVRSGSDGMTFPGFPIYLSDGEIRPTRPTPAPIVHQVMLVDIDGDDHAEAVIAHDDGYLYAVNVHTDEGSPSVLFSLYLGAPVMRALAADLDNDGALEILASPNDGHAYLVDGGEPYVRIETDIAGTCTAETRPTTLMRSN